MNPAAQHSRLICLVVAGGDADVLRGWLGAVRPWADAVVALAEGPTAAVLAALEDDDLVRAVVPGAPGAPGEADLVSAAANRLLAAADSLEAEWVLWLGVDEWVPPCDTGPLREFLATDALPGVAYGFGTDDGGMEFRLFAHRPGQRVPPDATTDRMVPDGIPRELWVRTTLSVQRGVKASRRERASGAPVLASTEPPWDAGSPCLSAVAVCPDDAGAADLATRLVAGLVEQVLPEAFEVIVVGPGETAAARLRDRFPTVEVVVSSGAARFRDAHAAGLARARGDYVMFLGPGTLPAPGCLAAAVRAHDDGHLVVTGRVVNGVRTAAGQASFLLDHSANLAIGPEVEVAANPVPTSYVREVLLAHGGFPVPPELAGRAHRVDEVFAVHDTGCRTVADLVRHHLRRGVATARTDLAAASGWRLLPPGHRRVHGLGQVRRRLAEVSRGSGHPAVDGRGTPRLLVALAATAEWAGFRMEVLRAARRRGVGLTRAGFAGADVPLAPRGSGPQERGHTGAVLDVLYPLEPYHPRLARVPVALRRTTRRTLTRGVVALHLLRCRGVEIVGITGSVGKTTTKDLLGEILAVAGPTIRTRANENGLWGVPASLLAIRPSDRYAVLELGIKRESGEMRWMAGLFRPRVAVLTGIGIFHTEALGSMEAIAREKRALLERLDPSGTAVVNADDQMAADATRGLRCRVVRVGWAHDADVRIVSARSAWPHGIELELDVAGEWVRGRVGVHGHHLVPLVAMAVAAANALGIPPAQALDAAGAFSPRVGRFSPAAGPRGSMVIVDDWKSRVPNAVAAVEALGATRARNRIAVLGEVQVDEQTVDTYRPVAQALVTAADRVIAVGRCGPPLEQLLAGTTLGVALRQVADADAAAAVLSADLGPGDVALLHGAGHHDLELVSLRLDPESDPAWLEDWRLRPFSRVGRPVAEVLAVLGTGDAASLLESQGAALTYAATSGHRLTPDGRFVPIDDAAVVEHCVRLGVAPLLALTPAEPGSSAAMDRVVASVVEHVVARGHRGVLIDLTGSTDPGPRLESLVWRLARRLREVGRWSVLALSASGAARVTRVAGAVDFVVIEASGGDGVVSPESLHRIVSSVGRQTPAGSILLSCQQRSSGEAADHLEAEMSTVRSLGLKGFAVQAGSMPVVCDVVGHRFQIRRRVWAGSDGGAGGPASAGRDTSGPRRPQGGV